MRKLCAVLRRRACSRAAPARRGGARPCKTPSPTIGASPASSRFSAIQSYRRLIPRNVRPVAWPGILCPLVRIALGAQYRSDVAGRSSLDGLPNMNPATGNPACDHANLLPVLFANAVAFLARHSRRRPRAGPVPIFVRPPRSLVYVAFPSLDGIGWSILAMRPAICRQMVDRRVSVICHAASVFSVRHIWHDGGMRQRGRFLLNIPLTSARGVAAAMLRAGT